jgi:hypothetical protein
MLEMFKSRPKPAEEAAPAEAPAAVTAGEEAAE